MIAAWNFTFNVTWNFIFILTRNFIFAAWNFTLFLCIFIVFPCFIFHRYSLFFFLTFCNSPSSNPDWWLKREEKKNDWWKWNVIWLVFSLCWSDLCWDYVCWWKMLNEMLIKMLFEMLIEMLFDNLMKFRQDCIRRWKCVRCTNEFSMISEMLHPTLKQSNALTNLRVLSKKLHLTMKRSDALTGLRILSKKLHLTMKRSSALTNLRWCQKNCIQRWNDWMHWRIFFFFVCYQAEGCKLLTMNRWRELNDFDCTSIDPSDLADWLTNRLTDQVDRLINKSNRLNYWHLIDFSIEWLVRSTNWLIDRLHDSSIDIWLFDRCVVKRIAFTYEIEFIRWMHWRIFFLTDWWRKWTEIMLLIIFSSFVRFHCLQTIFYVHRRHFFAFSDRFELYDRIRRFSYSCKTRIWLI